jgi:hypothetical protein
MNALLPLLQQVFCTVRQFEFDDAFLAIVYPAVQKLITLRENQGDKIHSRKLRKGYRDRATIIRERTFDKMNYVFQLAFIPTPGRCEQARGEMFGQGSNPIDPSLLSSDGGEPTEEFTEEENAAQETPASQLASKVDESNEMDDADPSTHPSLCPTKGTDLIAMKATTWMSARMSKDCE